LRFLHLHGGLTADLTGSVGTVQSVRLATVPKGVDVQSLRRLLASLDRSCAVGLRDHALVLLLASHGVRGGQLRRWHLQDIDWQHALPWSPRTVLVGVTHPGYSLADRTPRRGRRPGTKARIEVRS
jgi:integrase